MNENIKQLRKLALILDVSGMAIPISNTKLYQGAFGYVLLQVYVPITQNRTPGTSPLCTVHRTTIDSAGNRKQFNLDKYNLVYVDDVMLNGAEYMIFENPLPKTFTADTGEIEIVINYSEIATNEIGEKIITSRLTTNIYHAQVAEGGVSDSQTNTDLKGQEVAQINANTIAIEQMKDDVDNLLLPPDDSEANLEGTARVEITEDGRFKFSYLKGREGDKGDIPAHNWDGTSLQFENPDGSYGEFVNLIGRTGDKGNDGLAVNIIGGILNNPTELPVFGETNIGDAYLVTDVDMTLSMYAHTDSTDDWTIIHNWNGIPGPQGIPGPSNVLSIGTVISGDTASATITGNSPSQVLNLILPKGDKGEQGGTGPQGSTYFYNAEYSFDDTNNIHVLTIAEAEPELNDNISICTKLGQDIAVDDDVKIVWAASEWNVKVYDVVSGGLTAVETQNPITFTAGGSQSQIFFRAGASDKLWFDEFTFLNKEQDINGQYTPVEFYNEKNTIYQQTISSRIIGEIYAICQLTNTKYFVVSQSREWNSGASPEKAMAVNGMIMNIVDGVVSFGTPVMLQRSTGSGSFIPYNVQKISENMVLVCYHGDNADARMMVVQIDSDNSFTKGTPLSIYSPDSYSNILTLSQTRFVLARCANSESTTPAITLELCAINGLVVTKLSTYNMPAVSTYPVWLYLYKINDNFAAVFRYSYPSNTNNIRYYSYADDTITQLDNKTFLSALDHYNNAIGIDRLSETRFVMTNYSLRDATKLNIVARIINFSVDSISISAPTILAQTDDTSVDLTANNFVLSANGKFMISTMKFEQATGHTVPHVFNLFLNNNNYLSSSMKFTADITLNARETIKKRLKINDFEWIFIYGVDNRETDSGDPDYQCTISTSIVVSRVQVGLVKAISDLSDKRKVDGFSKKELDQDKWIINVIKGE
mgnify:CR=1 FL=1